MADLRTHQKREAELREKADLHDNGWDYVDAEQNDPIPFSVRVLAYRLYGFDPSAIGQKDQERADAEGVLSQNERAVLVRWLEQDDLDLYAVAHDLGIYISETKRYLRRAVMKLDKYPRGESWHRYFPETGHGPDSLWDADTGSVWDYFRNLYDETLKQAARERNRIRLDTKPFTD